MDSIKPISASQLTEIQFIEDIEQHYLSILQKGFMLSARDHAIIREWYRKRYPVLVIKRGIAQGIENYRASHAKDTPLPHSLSYFVDSVDEALRRYVQRMMPALSPESLDDQTTSRKLLDHIIELLTTVGKAEHKEDRLAIYRNLYRRMMSLRRSGDPKVIYGELHEMRSRLAPEYRALLSEEERADIDARLEKILDDEGKHMSPVGRDELYHSRLEEILEKEHGLFFPPMSRD
jgi:hypothetical protein